MDNQDYKHFLQIGIEKTNHGKFDEALEALDKAEELNPNSATVYFSRAVVFHNQMDLESAYENYTKAIQCDEKMTDAYYNRAQVVMLKDKEDKEALKGALADLDKSIDLDNKFVDAYYYAAVIKKVLEDYNGAFEYLNKALEIEPNAVYSRALKKLILQKYLKRNEE